MKEVKELIENKVDNISWASAEYKFDEYITTCKSAYIEEILNTEINLLTRNYRLYDNIGSSVNIELRN